MPSYLHPGVYVEEIPSGSKPIEGVGTSTAAFVGYTTKGPIGEPTLISKWDDYDKIYGGVRNLQKEKKGDPMGLSVSAFFQNGGTKAYIVRITDAEARKAIGYLDDPLNSATGKVLIFTALNEGSWANGILVKLSVSPLDSRLYDVSIGRNDDKDIFIVVERFASVSLDTENPQFIRNVINGVSDLITVDLGVIPATVTADEYLGTSVSGNFGSTFSLDLSDSTLFPDAASRTLSIAIDGFTAINREISSGTGSTLVEIATAIEAAVRSGTGATTDRQKFFSCVVKNNKLVLTSGTRKPASSVVVAHSSVIAKTLKLGVAYLGSSTSGDLSLLTYPVELSDIVEYPDALSRTISGSVNGTVFNLVLPASNLADLDDIASALDVITDATCVAINGKLVLTSTANTPTSSVVISPGAGITTTLKLGIGNGGVEITGQQYCDVNCGVQLTGKETADTTLPQDTLDGGVDGGLPSETNYVNVFTKFIKYRDINILCLPGQHWTSTSSGNPIIQKAIGHAEKMKSRMVIIDPPPSYELDNAKKVIDMDLPSQTYSVLYYPWVEVANRFYHAERFPGLPKTILVPPSGYAAGMWAKTDANRGVWKAPAGMATGLLGISNLEYKVEDDEQDSLNPQGVNCFRSMPGAGKVIWGTRTLATKADPEWRYVPVRRTAIMIEQSIYEGIQWAVFEPNDHRLWSALRANIGNFMNGMFRVGAFQGEKASDAYFVRCNLGDTMTQGEIDAGQVIVIVGFAPVKPAEFVIVRIQQKVNQQ